MKMCYRGVSYDYNPTQIQVLESSNDVKFRGNTYKPNRVALELKVQDKENIVYRGVAFSERTQTRFLGQVCEKNPVGLTVPKKKTRFLGQLCDNSVAAPMLANATV